MSTLWPYVRTAAHYTAAACVFTASLLGAFLLAVIGAGDDGRH